MIKKMHIAAVMAIIGLNVLPAAAQNSYPADKPITIIVPFAAGSGTDTLARILTKNLNEGDFKNATFIVEDKPGADGIIGASDAAKAAPDGYTLFLTTNTTHSVNPYIHKTLPYDPNKDFVPIGLLGETAPALLTSGTNPVSTVKEVVDLVKSKPNELNFAATNTSSLAAAQMLEKRTGSKVVIVKYKAAPEALTDTMTGTMQYFFGDLASGGGLARSGKIKALAVLSAKRLPGFDQVPTMAEAGYPHMEIPIWIGMFAPKGTPADIVDRISRAIVVAQGKQEFIDALARGAVNVRTTTPATFTKYVADQYQFWGKLAKEINLEAE
jgi:tripartite-type tricarboxylate transporter receptor subunit TctC